MEARVEGESNSVTRLIRGRDSDGAQQYVSAAGRGSRQGSFCNRTPTGWEGGGSSWLFFGAPSFLPSDQDFVTPIEMDSAAASAL